jgi:hypothetical protein
MSPSQLQQQGLSAVRALPISSATDGTAGMSAGESWQILTFAGAVLNFPALPVDSLVAIGDECISAARRGPMKLKTMLLVIAAVVAVLAPQAAPAQDQPAPATWNAVSQAAAWLGAGPVEPNCGIPGCADPVCGIDPGRRYAAEDFSCGDGTCGRCPCCCKRLDIWGSAELLLWWGKGSALPPLVTTSPPGTAQADAGVLGESGTSVLFGLEQAGKDMQVGGRLTLGLWLDADQNVSIANRFYGLGGQDTQFSAASTGDPILARPFFNAFLGVPDALLIAFPGLVEGNIDAQYQTQNFLGNEVILEMMMDRQRHRRVNLLFGYHFLRMDDWLQINSFHTIVDGPFAGTTFDIMDRFSTQNEFHGGMVGIRSIRSRGCLSLDTLLKVSVGSVRQRVAIAGETLIDGAPEEGGLLAQPSNIGVHERDRLLWVPELTMNLKYHVNPCLSLHLGYNLMWMSQVVTAGEQIDLNVNLNQPIGPAVPQFQFHDENYWLQGINFGVNWDF